MCKIGATLYHSTSSQLGTSTPLAAKTGNRWETLKAEAPPLDSSSLRKTLAIGQLAKGEANLLNFHPTDQTGPNLVDNIKYLPHLSLELPWLQPQTYFYQRIVSVWYSYSFRSSRILEVAIFRSFCVFAAEGQGQRSGVLNRIDRDGFIFISSLLLPENLGWFHPIFESCFCIGAGERERG